MAFQQPTIGAARAKFGIYGGQGTGKTWTAVNIAIGLAQHIQSTKPIFFVDSEKGSDFHIDRIRNSGLDVLVDKTLSFADLIQDIDTAERDGDILIIDSISHFWRELMQSLKAKKHSNFLTMLDIVNLKQKWQEEYVRRYVNSQLHIIMCGRSANIFEDVEDDDAGRNAQGKPKFKPVKRGTRMSAEGETGYEPDVLIEMQRVLLEDGGRFAREAVVLKERFGVLDGKTFRDPTFADFAPFIDRLNLGGKQVGYDASRHSTEIFADEDEDAEERKILLEETQGIIISLFPGSSGQDKKAKADVMQAAFATRSWSAIQKLPVPELEAGKEKLEFFAFHLGQWGESGNALPDDLVRWCEQLWLEEIAKEQGEPIPTSAQEVA